MICLPEGVKIAKPGDNLTVRAKLNFPLTITKGSRFALREGGKTIAAGIVTDILPEETELDTGKQKKAKPVETPAPTPAATEAPKTDGKGVKSPAKPADSKTEAKPAAGKAPAPPTKAPSPAGKVPPPAAGKVPPPPPGGKKPVAPPGKVPPPPPAGKKPVPPPPGKGPKK